LQASQDAERQARARFQAGLATLVDVAEAQRLLVSAEIDDSLARLTIWRSLERLAAAQGNLQPFLDQVDRADAAATTGVK
jgi:outer membrane protein